MGHVPKSMSEALEFDDPEAALNALADASALGAQELAAALLTDMQDFSLELPKVLHFAEGEEQDDGNTHELDDERNHHQFQTHPLRGAIACADSIYGSLTKIAVGGSQASSEIRQLEQEKEAIEEEAACIATALALRGAEAQTNAAWANRDFATASRAIQPWLRWKQENEHAVKHSGGSAETTSLNKKKNRVVAYTGEYALEQLDRTYQQLQQVLLQKYEQAIQQGNLQLVGQYTPLLGKLQLEPKAVQLYLQFLREIMNKSVATSAEEEDAQQASFQVQMAKVYNGSVSIIRHHLPMVSHCLYKAQGEVAVVRLVHEHCSETVLPIWRNYQRQRQLGSVRRHAERIADLYEQGDVDPESDAGFNTHIGSLPDVDSAMEEAATCIKHAESYLRFAEHTCDQVNKARQMRHENQMKAGMNSAPYKPVEVLPASTSLHEMVAEVGGQYVVIERCLLLASMHRAYASEANMEEARYYLPLAIRSGGNGGQPSSNSKALQSVLIETCFYAARRASLRAFATGHTGTASAMANFCSEALSSGFLDLLRQRAEEFGVALLKPGDGLLVGSANYFSQATSIIGRQPPPSSAGAQKLEDFARRSTKTAQACALLNDIQAAVFHTEQLMTTLMEAIARGFPKNSHSTEQLELCVKGLSVVQDQFKGAVDSSVESLESIMKPRIRSIVGEAVGSESSAAFMVSPVMGQHSNQSGATGGAAGGPSTRMNYDLDEEAYNFLQLGEGFMAHLFALLDELVQPLRTYLAPPIWDNLWLNIVGTTAKRLETLLRKTRFTALGALAFDSDMRDLVTFTRDMLVSDQYSSNAAVTKACSPLGRLSQLAKVLNVDEAEDVLDVISLLKRKSNLDWKLDDAQAFLELRFPEQKVKEVLRLQEQDM